LPILALIVHEDVRFVQNEADPIEPHIGRLVDLVAMEVHDYL
jgi:hypothetical protein